MQDLAKESHYLPKLYPQVDVIYRDLSKTRDIGDNTLTTQGMSSMQDSVSNPLISWLFQARLGWNVEPQRKHTITNAIEVRSHYFSWWLWGLTIASTLKTGIASTDVPVLFIARMIAPMISKTGEAKNDTTWRVRTSIWAWARPLKF